MCDDRNKKKSVRRKPNTIVKKSKTQDERDENKKRKT